MYIESTETLHRIFSMHFCEVFLRTHTFLKEGKNTYLAQHQYTLVGQTKPNGGYPCSASWTDLAYGIGYFTHKSNKNNNNSILSLFVW
jgi:hypothetical protein